MNACAYVVGPAGGSGAALLAMASRLGFTSVLAYDGVPAAEERTRATPIAFFLFAAVDDPRALASTVAAIRGSAIPDIRFAPLIYFAGNPSLAEARLCINLGFDDVVTRPFARARLRERIAQQLDRTCVYFETAGYFGPDRRDRLHDSSAHTGRGSGGQYRRLEIVRCLPTGISILSDELQVVV